MRWLDLLEADEEQQWFIIGDNHARMVEFAGAERFAETGATTRDIIRQALKVADNSNVIMSAGHIDLIKTLRPNIRRIAFRVNRIIDVLKEKNCNIVALVPPVGSKNLNQDLMEELREELIKVYEEAGVDTIDQDKFSMSSNGRMNNRGVYVGMGALITDMALQWGDVELAPGDTSGGSILAPTDSIPPTPRPSGSNDSGDDAGVAGITGTGNAPGQTDNIPQYPAGLSMRTIEGWIREEAELRGMDANIAIRVFRSEGYNNYQSTVTTGNQLKRYGREASYGPYQLYVGRGLGNDYENRTGRDLRTDNTNEGIRNQIRFALDMAVSLGWGPWYGYRNTISNTNLRLGLTGARRARNWN